jgi:hypothetical protein
MALSDDQRALLRLLAGREEGYEDIAALKGKSVEEVRAEVKDALARLQAEEPAEEQSSKRMSEPVQSPPVEEPSVPVPASESPQQPEAPQVKPKAAAPPPPATSGKPKAGPRRPIPQIPAERRRLVLLAGGALAIVAAALGAVAIFSGGSGSDSSSGNAASRGESTFADTPAAKNEKITRAILEPVAGGDGEGIAIFGRAGKQVRLAVAGKGLEPAPSGKAYVVWLANPENHMLPVNAVAVNRSGEIASQYPVPAAVLVSVAEGAFSEIDVTLVSAARYKAAFAKARKEGKFPTYTGSDVLRGPIAGPIVGAAKKKSGG